MSCVGFRNLHLRLISFVLLLAYGLPTVLGVGAHTLQECSGHLCKTACHSHAHAGCCHHGHHHEHEADEDGDQGPALKQAGHDHSQCLMCKFLRMSVVSSLPPIDICWRGVAFDFLGRPAMQPDSRSCLARLARGPPRFVEISL
jgi:hypothetical protein